MYSWGSQGHTGVKPGVNPASGFRVVVTFDE